MTFNPLGMLTRSIGFSNGWANDSYIPEFKTAFMFDLRVMDKAVSESGGSAANTNNLGAVSYVFDDLDNNDGNVTLPYG